MFHITVEVKLEGQSLFKGFSILNVAYEPKNVLATTYTLLPSPSLLTLLSLAINPLAERERERERERESCGDSGERLAVKNQAPQTSQFRVSLIALNMFWH